MILTAQIARGQRDADRKALSATGTMRRSPPTPIDVLVEDLSITGFRMNTDISLSIDDRITIGISGMGQHEAVVVRGTADGFGCEFVRPLTASLLDEAGNSTARSINPEIDPSLDPAAIARWSSQNEPVVASMKGQYRFALIAALAAASWGLVYVSATLI